MAAIALGDEAGGGQFFFGKAAAAQVGQEVVPALRRLANAEAFGDCLIKTSR